MLKLLTHFVRVENLHGHSAHTENLPIFGIFPVNYCFTIYYLRTHRRIN